MSDPEARAEIFPDQVTLMARRDAIEGSLNRLRNLIQGRGVAPIGSPALAELTNTAQDNWRQIRERLLADMLPHPYDVSEALEHWERKVNEIADRAASEGIAEAVTAKVAVTHTVTSPGDAVQVVETRLASAGGDFLRGAAVIVGGLGLLWWWSRGR